jgi:hypothetical protein
MGDEVVGADELALQAARSRAFTGIVKFWHEYNIQQYGNDRKKSFPELHGTDRESRKAWFETIDKRVAILQDYASDHPDYEILTEAQQNKVMSGVEKWAALGMDTHLREDNNKTRERWGHMFPAASAGIPRLVNEFRPKLDQAFGKVDENKADLVTHLEPRLEQEDCLPWVTQAANQWRVLMADMMPNEVLGREALFRFGIEEVPDELAAMDDMAAEQKAAMSMALGVVGFELMCIRVNYTKLVDKFRTEGIYTIAQAAHALQESPEFEEFRKASSRRMPKAQVPGWLKKYAGTAKPAGDNPRTKRNPRGRRAEEEAKDDTKGDPKKRGGAPKGKCKYCFEHKLAADWSHDIGACKAKKAGITTTEALYAKFPGIKKEREAYMASRGKKANGGAGGAGGAVNSIVVPDEPTEEVPTDETVEPEAELYEGHGADESKGTEDEPSDADEAPEYVRPSIYNMTARPGIDEIVASRLARNRKMQVTNAMILRQGGPAAQMLRERTRA